MKIIFDTSTPNEIKMQIRKDLDAIRLLNDYELIFFEVDTFTDIAFTIARIIPVRENTLSYLIDRMACKTGIIGIHKGDLWIKTMSENGERFYIVRSIKIDHVEITRLIQRVSVVSPDGYRQFAWKNSVPIGPAVATQIPSLNERLKAAENTKGSNETDENDTIDALVENVILLQKQVDETCGVDCHDADTELANTLKDIDPCVSGQALELLDIYKETNDKNSFKALFEALTGCRFIDYLQKSYETLHKSCNSEPASIPAEDCANIGESVALMCKHCDHKTGCDNCPVRRIMKRTIDAITNQ